MADCLAHVALAATTLLAWLGLGSLVLVRGPSVGDRLLDFLTRLGVGAVSFAILTFAAGWARLLYAAPYIVIFAAAALVGVAGCVSFWREVERPQFRDWAPWQLALLALLIAYVSMDLIAVSAPISSPDALLYHASDPALFAGAHRIFTIPWNSSSYEPFSVEMLVLDGFLLWNSVQGAFAPLLLALVTLAVICGFAQRIAGRSAALLAGAIFFAQPFMLWTATSTYIESGIALAVALATWHLIRFIQGSEQSGLALAGVFAGAAAGMKYVGLIAVIVLAVVAAVVLARRLNLRLLLRFGAPAIAVAAPWYVKNAIVTGNPIYPHIFGGLNASATNELNFTIQSFGYGHRPVDLLLLPIRLLAAARPFDGGQYLSPLFLIFAPVALALGRPRAAIVAAWGGVLLYVMAWFFTTQQARFLAPVMPIMAVLAALGARALAQQGRLAQFLSVGVTVGALTVNLGGSVIYAKQFVPVVFGSESTDQFLREKVSNFEGVDWLNRNLGPHARVATDIWALLYLRMPYVTFGTMGDLLPDDAGPAATRAFVTRYRVTDIAILDGDTARRRQAGYLHARLIARVSVRSVQSRTRGHYGRRHNMLVYSISR